METRKREKAVKQEEDAMSSPSEQAGSPVEEPEPQGEAATGDENEDQSEPHKEEEEEEKKKKKMGPRRRRGPQKKEKEATPRKRRTRDRLDPIIAPDDTIPQCEIQGDDVPGQPALLWAIGCERMFCSPHYVAPVEE